ncbi:MAG: hypothetical protein ACRDOE_12985, partial [Streptosporangiaceae bacterium]
EYIQVAQKEHDAFVPLRQQEMGELQTVLTPIQWQVFQQQQAARRHPPRLPDLCRHLDPLPPGAASPRPPPKH